MTVKQHFSKLAQAWSWLRLEKEIINIQALSDRVIDELTLGLCVAFDENHALYMARKTGQEKIDCSVLISRPDAPTIDSEYWSFKKIESGLTIRTARPDYNFLMNQTGLPPKQAWERFKPLFQRMLTPKAIEERELAFSLVKLHYVPGLGYLANRDTYRLFDSYVDQLRRHGFLDLAKTQRDRGKGLTPFHCQVYQLGVALIYSINNIVVWDCGGYGPWRHWLEPIASVLLDRQNQPPNQEQLIAICETQLTKSGLARLSDIFANEDALSGDVTIVYEWWNPAANCLAQKHKQGNFYGYLEPKAFWFKASSWGIDLPDTKSLDFSAPEIGQTGPTIQSDLYSLALIFAVLVTKPSDRPKLYQKDWSVMPPSLQNYILPHLNPDPYQRTQSVSGLKKAVTAGFGLFVREYYLERSS